MIAGNSCFSDVIVLFSRHHCSGPESNSNLDEQSTKAEARSITYQVRHWAGPDVSGRARHGAVVRAVIKTVKCLLSGRIPSKRCVPEQQQSQWHRKIRIAHVLRKMFVKAKELLEFSDISRLGPVSNCLKLFRVNLDASLLTM